MAEATIATPKPKTSKPGAFEMPKFDMPKFDMPKVEMPAAFREFAERGVAQAKDTYEKMKAAAEEATDVLESTYSTATKGASDYGLKVIEDSAQALGGSYKGLGQYVKAFDYYKKCDAGTYAETAQRGAKQIEISSPAGRLRS